MNFIIKRIKKNKTKLRAIRENKKKYNFSKY